MHLRLIALIAMFNTSSVASAKGLDELGQSNPETKAEDSEADSDESADQTDNKAATAPAISQPPSALSKTVAEKLQLSTSFGWIKASKSSGNWKSSGVSDLGIAYQIMKLSSQLGLLATFRYTPISVSGTQEKHMYRGAWEVYNLGAKATYRISSKITALGSGELGYVKSSLVPTDGLPKVASHSAGGAIITLGGGADFAFSDIGNFSAGPRIFAGFGTYSAFQLSAAASFLF